MSSAPDKIYYNVTINYNDHKLASTDRGTSIAQTEINVLDPLVENSNMYDLCISKFRLDTFTIPLVIPELKQPQIIEDDKIELNYTIKLLVTKEDHTEFKKTTIIGEKEYTNYGEQYLTLNGKHWLQKGDVKTEGTNPVETHGYFNMEDSFKRKKPVVKYDSEDSSKGYIDNLDPFCYIYEPQEFIDSINNALVELVKPYLRELNSTKKSPMADEQLYKEIRNYAFFKLNGSTLEFYQENTLIPIIFVFSPNLYKYFGFGFNTKRVDAEGGWMICNDPDSRNLLNVNSDCQNLTEFANIDYKSARTDYKIAECKFSITQTWNACKLILICSSNLPIKGEYVPINEHDGLLIHDNTEYTREIFNIVHDGVDSPTSLGENSMKTPSIKVLESFYPASSTGGDMRTQIIYSNESMDTGTKLSIQGEYSALKKFDISIKWVDIFNNLHDLELMPGTSCDIRIGFVKKAVKHDLVLAGFKEILRTLRGEARGPPSKKRTTNSYELTNGGFDFPSLKF